MAADHLLVLDAGSSGARCLIARPGAGSVAVARRHWDYETPPEIAPFGKSFDADAFWAILCQVTRQALRDAGLEGGDIAAVGVTSQRLALVVVDGDGHALYAGPNLDLRALAEGLAIDARLADQVYQVTGKLPSLLLAPARLQWLRRHRELDFQRAAAVLSLGDWVAYRLTGELYAERSLAGDCGLLNVITGERDEALLTELEVPARLLPPLIASGGLAGQVMPRAAKATGLAPGIPVVIAGADTQCGLLGLGVKEPGEVGIVAGWSCPLQQVMAEPRHDPQRRTWLCLHVLPERWLVESSAADAGRVWRWWSQTLLGDGSALEEAAALAAQASPGAGDVLAQLGPRAMNVATLRRPAGGVFLQPWLAIGMVGRPELLRAALENIAYALRANLEQAVEVSGREAERIALGGGFTRAPLFSRLVAEVLGRPIEVAPEDEVTARGAAVLTARAVGLSEKGLASPTRCIEGEPAAVLAYQGLYERWRWLGEALAAVGQEGP